MYHPSPSHQPHMAGEWLSSRTLSNPSEDKTGLTTLWNPRMLCSPLLQSQQRGLCRGNHRLLPPEMPTSPGAPPTHPLSMLGQHTHAMALSHPSSHTRIGMLRHPRKSSVWSSVGPAVPFARADLTICLKYLGTTGWTASWCHSGGPGKLLAAVTKLCARV